MEHVEHPLEHDTNYAPAERSGVREMIAPLNAMGDNVTIQKNWQELIRPSKLQVAPGGDMRRSATVVAEPLGGVGDARKPPIYLHDGDIVEVEIESVGLIRNRIVAEREPRVNATWNHAPSS